MPPAKRRRGLAGSIVTTALSAALIGAAVGMTVYKLSVPLNHLVHAVIFIKLLSRWRDRGKEPDASHPSSPPPPPYEEKWTKPPVSPSVFLVGLLGA